MAATPTAVLLVNRTDPKWKAVIASDSVAVSRSSVRPTMKSCPIRCASVIDASVCSAQVGAGVGLEVAGMGVGLELARIGAGDWKMDAKGVSEGDAKGVSEGDAKGVTDGDGTSNDARGAMICGAPPTQPPTITVTNPRERQCARQRRGERRRLSSRWESALRRGCLIICNRSTQ